MNEYPAHLRQLSLSVLLDVWDRNHADWLRARNRHDWELEQVLRRDRDDTAEEMKRRSLERTTEAQHHD